METAGSKKQNTEEPREEVECQTPTQPSTSSAKTQAMGEKTNKQTKPEKDNSCKPKEKSQNAETLGHARRKVSVPPFPKHLPLSKPDTPRCSASIVPAHEAEP